MAGALAAGYSFEPLGDQHDRAAFSCSVDALDRYFRMQAGQEGRRRVASCFVLAAADGSVAGYYTLSATSIAFLDLPPALAKRLPRHPVVPATLMGRLAVHENRHGQGLGELLLFDAFSRTLRSDIASYALLRRHFVNTTVSRRLPASGVGFFCHWPRSRCCSDKGYVNPQ
jgi:GNAT superfamily N-acetyltransferase